MLLCACAWSEDTRKLSVTKNVHGKLEVVEDWVGGLINAEFSNKINSTGYSLASRTGIYFGAFPSQLVVPVDSGYS